MFLWDWMAAIKQELDQFPILYLIVLLAAIMVMTGLLP